MTACTPSAGADAPDDAAARPPRVSLVGVNGHGRSHLRVLLGMHLAGRLRLHQLVDPAPLGDVAAQEAARAAAPEDVAAARAALAGATVLPDLGAALADRPDVLVLSTPIHTHAALATRALRAGCDVLLEKPPTTSLAELAALLAVEATSRGVVQVGFQTFGSSALPELRRIVASGEIGELRGVAGVGTWVRTTAYWRRSAWTGRRTLDGSAVVDGVVTNPLAHAVALALNAGGARTVDDVAEVRLDQYRAHDIEADDTSVVHVVTDRGLPVTLALTLCSDEHRRPWITLQGSEGRATYDYYTDELDVEGRAGRRTFRATRVPLLENLLEHRLTGAPLLCPLRDTGAFMRVLEAVRTAPDPVRIPPDVVVRRTTEEGETLVLPDALHWCRRAAEEHATFRELGAPWARTTVQEDAR